MDYNANDIFVEFLEVAFHYLLFVNRIYPKEIFEDRKKYGVSVKYSIHPEVNDYLKNCLVSIKEILASQALEKVVFCIKDPDDVEKQKFVFEPLGTKVDSTYGNDHYLIKCEQGLRAFFLKLANSEAFSGSIREGSSFSVMIHTNESAALNLSKKPELEHFPLIEHESSSAVDETEYSILPIHTIDVDLFKIQVYLETICT